MDVRVRVRVRVRVSVLAHYPSWYASNLFKIDLGFLVLLHAGWQGGARLAPQLGQRAAFWTRCDNAPDATPVTVQGWA
jgi:hypothetical protein